MPTRYVSKKKFDTFGAPRADETITEEVEWFADDEGVVIGLITCDKANPNYSISILGRDQHGVFHTFHTDTGFTAVESARRRLFERMERALATGNWRKV